MLPAGGLETARDGLVLLFLGSTRIRLHDLVHDETELLFAEIDSPSFGAHTQLQPAEEVATRVAKYGALCEVLLSVFVVGGYWGEEWAIQLWVYSANDQFSVFLPTSDCEIFCQQ